MVTSLELAMISESVFIVLRTGLYTSCKVN